MLKIRTVQQTVAASPRPVQPPDGSGSDLEGGGEGIEEVMETSPTPPGPGIP